MPEIISRKEARALGLTRFCTGKLCKHGHVAERRVSSGICCECHKVNRRAWKKKNKSSVGLTAERWRKRTGYYALREQRRRAAVRALKELGITI